MRKFLPHFSLLLSIITGLVLAQNNSNLSAKRINSPYYDGEELRAFFTADDVNSLPGGLLEAKQFSVKTFHNGDTNQVEIVVTAPVCILYRDAGGYSAWLPGTIQVFTPTTNYFIEGRGFLWSQ